MNETIRILLVDDNMITRASLATLLRAQHNLDVVGEASDGKMAVELTHELRPDVIIMDVRMPVLNGIEATRLIMLDYPKTRVIGFTMQSELGLGAAMLGAGAAACINKSDPIDVLIATIQD